MDITMCKAINKDKETCPIKDKCERHTAKPHPHRQSYFMIAPFSLTDMFVVDCNYYAEVEK